MTERGFSLVELMVVMVIAGLLLGGFTTFYLAEQKSLRHHQISVESSQNLRLALEQMSRDIRSARKDFTRDFRTNTGGNPDAAILTATATNIEFQLDANDDGTVTTTSNDEHKGYRLTGTTLESLDAATNTWFPLADNVSQLQFTYLDCNGAATAVLANIAQVGISITMTAQMAAANSGVGITGIGISKTENEIVKLRNVRCT